MIVEVWLTRTHFPVSYPVAVVVLSRVQLSTCMHASSTNYILLIIIHLNIHFIYKSWRELRDHLSSQKIIMVLQLYFLHFSSKCNVHVRRNINIRHKFARFYNSLRTKQSCHFYFIFHDYWNFFWVYPVSVSYSWSY